MNGSGWPGAADRDELNGVVSRRPSAARRSQRPGEANDDVEPGWDVEPGRDIEQGWDFESGWNVEPDPRGPRQNVPGRHRGADDGWLTGSPVTDYDRARLASGRPPAQRDSTLRDIRREQLRPALPPAQRDSMLQDIRREQFRPAVPQARVVSKPRQRVRGMNAALESGVAGVGEMAPARKPARPRQLVLAVLVAMAGVVAGVLTYKSLAGSPVSLSGEVVPMQVYPLSFGAPGTITAVKIQAGQHVTAGEVLATQDSTLAQANLQEAQAAATAAAATLSADQHPPAGVAVLPAAVALAQQRLAAARAQVAADELAVKDTQVVAPAAGVVGALSATAGGSITDSNLHSPVVTIDSGPLVVSAHLPGTEVGNVRVGQAVTLTIEPLHMSLPGKVLRLTQVPSPSQTAVGYTVLCQIDGQDSALLPGMAADVSPR